MRITRLATARVSFDVYTASEQHVTVNGFGYKTTNPKNILGANCLQWCRADQGITIATGLSQWDDLSGNSKNYIQATGGAQPTWGATSGPNNTPALTFDGIDDVLTTTLSLPAPGTTPSWIWLVMKSITFTNTDRIYSAANSSSTITLVQVSPSPSLAIYNGLTVGTNADLAVGTWGAVEAYFSNSTADYVQINDNAKVTGVSAANNSTTGRTLGAGVGTLFGNIGVAEIVYANTLPSAAQLAAFSAYRLARYGF